MSGSRLIAFTLIALFAASWAQAYVPVRVSVAADAPAVVQVTGEGVLPIRWERGEATTATLPLLTWPWAPETPQLSLPGSYLLTGPNAPPPAWFAPLVPTRLAGPEPDAPAPAAYEPVLGYTPGVSSAARRLAVLLACLAVIVVLAVLLLPGLRGTAAASGVALLAAGGLALFLGPSPGPGLAEGRVVVSTQAVIQADDWQWHIAREAARVRVPFHDATYLLPYSRRHVEQLSPRLVCAADGRPVAIEFALPAAGRAAVLRRSNPPAAREADVQAPVALRTLVMPLYARPGAAVTREAPGHWRVQLAE
ncbi:MAG: hypothetical protein ACFCVE_15250 [Phycisphaerae bacterium]